MSKQETSLYMLQRFIPDGSFELVAPFFKNNTVHLTLTRERKTVLGDYRHPTRDYPYHRISVNMNLNPYSFLITLLHELAHMKVFIHFKHNAAPHGKEWKTQFRHILIPFVGKRFFPKDVEKALVAYLHNPSASTCTDPALYRAFYKYDERKPGRMLVEDIEPGQWFQTDDGALFEKIAQLRTRCKCRDLRTRKDYYFQGIVEVQQVRRDRRRLLPASKTRAAA